MPTYFFDQMEWEDNPRGYYLTDVKQKTLWVNEETGATLALVKFPQGVADRLHTHPKANQIFFPISGEVERPSGRLELKADAVSIQPKGDVHGRTNFTKETTVLVYWDGPPEPQIAE